MAEITRVCDFMVEFRLNAEGDLEMQAIGEALQDHIWEKAFPLLALDADHRFAIPNRTSNASNILGLFERMPTYTCSLAGDPSEQVTIGLARPGRRRIFVWGDPLTQSVKT